MVHFRPDGAVSTMDEMYYYIIYINLHTVAMLINKSQIAAPGLHGALARHAIAVLLHSAACNTQLCDFLLFLFAS